MACCRIIGAMELVSVGSPFIGHFHPISLVYPIIRGDRRPDLLDDIRDICSVYMLQEVKGSDGCTDDSRTEFSTGIGVYNSKLSQTDDPPGY